jgi:hypothetical protein
VAIDAKAKAETLLAFEGLRPGLCVHIGGTGGELPAGLAVAGKYHVHCLTADRSNLKAMRQCVAEGGLYGQVVADHSLLTHLSYPENFSQLAQKLPTKPSQILPTLMRRLDQPLRITFDANKRR